jgi:plastocyanin
MRFSRISPGLVLIALLSACSKTEQPAPAPAGGGKKVDAATAGSLTGKAAFEGTPPAADALKMTGDPACVSAAGPNPMNDDVVVNNGGLQNVFVYVKSGLDPAYSFDAPSGPVELDQKACRYVPRVLGIRVGQELVMLNSDETLHTVHALPKSNREFNRSMQLKGERHTHRFSAPEAMVRFKCDVHGWMNAHVGVMAHPYFAVTKADGTFEIPGLPPGTYTIEAWHERFGTQTKEVTVGDKQAQDASFTFKS